MRLVLTLIILVNSALGFTQEAEFSVKGGAHKFPKTNEGEVLEHTFVIKNKGKSPLKIYSYQVECDCTKAVLPESEIAPGSQAFVKVTFDTEGKAYFQDRLVLLTTNTKRKTEKLRFKVNIVPKG